MLTEGEKDNNGDNHRDRALTASLSAGGGHVKIKTELGEELNGGGGNREGSEARTGCGEMLSC